MTFPQDGWSFPKTSNKVSKQYLKPGDVVILKQKDLINAPMMIIVGNDNRRFVTESKDTLKGVRCRWFTSQGQLQEATFSTKDLELVKTYNQD